MSEQLFEHTWRWFGPHDPISLEDVLQAGASGVVTALHEISIGEVWSVEDIRKRLAIIEGAGLTWSVAESLPIHENIKVHGGDRSKWIENYKQSIRNLGSCGIGIVCYNFMPLLDWARTDLRVRFRDGSITTRYESKAVAAFDRFILKRAGADEDYTSDELVDAERYFTLLDDAGRTSLEKAILLGFPGSGKDLTLEDLRSSLQSYPRLSRLEYAEHLTSFLHDVIPVAEEHGVRMAIHPDDPPWGLYGLPRAVSNADDLERLLSLIDSPSNGLTFCTGSLGASSRNDVSALARRFADRVHFLHLRNVTRTGPQDFVEADHLEGDVDMYDVVRTFLLEQKRRISEGRSDHRIPMRPDHGHLMRVDEGRAHFYPGYSLFGRMRGLAELSGLEHAIVRSFNT